MHEPPHWSLSGRPLRPVIMRLINAIILCCAIAALGFTVSLTSNVALAQTWLTYLFYPVTLVALVAISMLVDVTSRHLQNLRQTTQLRTLVERLNSESETNRNIMTDLRARLSAASSGDVYADGVNFSRPVISLLFNRGTLTEDQITALYADVRGLVNAAKVITPEPVEPQPAPVPRQPRARTITLDD